MIVREVFRGCRAAVVMVVFLGLVMPGSAAGGENMLESKSTGAVRLPVPAIDGGMSLEKTLSARRSVRSFKNESLTLDEVSRLLWAAQGVTHPRGFRTAPSAGALYPLEVVLAAGNVDGLASGVYRYRPDHHDLLMIGRSDIRDELHRAALHQTFVRDAPAVLVISAFFHRTTGKYGERGIRYVHMEVGHAAQNVLLEAVSLNLGAVVVGAFDDARVKRVLSLDAREEPLVVIPLGR